MKEFISDDWNSKPVSNRYFKNKLKNKLNDVISESHSIKSEIKDSISTSKWTIIERIQQKYNSLQKYTLLILVLFAIGFFVHNYSIQTGIDKRFYKAGLNCIEETEHYWRTIKEYKVQKDSVYFFYTGSKEMMWCLDEGNHISLKTTNLGSFNGYTKWLVNSDNNGKCVIRKSKSQRVCRYVDGRITHLE